MADELRPCATHPRHRAHGRCSVCSTDLCKYCLEEQGGHVLCSRCSQTIEDHDHGHLSAELEPPTSWPDGPVEPIEAPAPGAPASPPIAAPPDRARVRLPISVYLMLLTQAATIAVLAIALWRIGALPFTGRPEVAPGPSVIALDPPARTTDGERLTLSGRAPDTAFAALLVDGEVAAVEVVRDGRFRFDAIRIEAEVARLSIVAYDRTGASIESAPIWLSLAPVSTPVPPSDFVAPAPELPGVVTRATPVPAPTRPPITPGIVRSVPHATPPRIGSRRPRNILRGPRERHIALTFDGGSHASQALLVLDTLRAKGVRSTIFLTGDFISTYPDVTRRIVADGHEVGNHTVDHLHLADWVDGHGHITRPEVTRQVLVDQLTETSRRFEATTGRKMISYWRAPYGEINAEILRWAEGAGWTHVGWTQGLDTLDWVADPDDQLYRTSTEIRDRILTAARAGPARGGIVLMHLGADRMDPPAVELPRIIDGLRDEGYRLVTVSALVGS